MVGLALAFSVGVVVSILESHLGPLGLAATLIAALVGMRLLNRVRAEPLIAVLETTRAILPVVAFLSISLLVGRGAGNVAFDELGAQVIVVLLLALAIDARFFRLHAAAETQDVISILFTMLVLGIGEFYAVRGVLTHKPHEAGMVAGAIAAGFLGVSVTALIGGARRLEEAGSADEPEDPGSVEVGEAEGERSHQPPD
jgi:hypothetical protein